MTRITDRMLYVAAVAVTQCMTTQEINDGRTFPCIRRIREVSKAVATAVIEEALHENLTTLITKKHIDEGISNLVDRKMYFPDYVPLIDPRKGS